MANCGQACPYNTLDGCKVKEYNAICPLTNMATPVTEYRMTNGDRIRATTDEELAKLFTQTVADGCPPDMDWMCKKDEKGWDACDSCWLKWLRRPAEVTER